MNALETTSLVFVLIVNVLCQDQGVHTIKYEVHNSEIIQPEEPNYLKILIMFFFFFHF